MKIQCPSCGFAADSNGSKIPEQQTVARCPKCKTTFSVSQASVSQEQNLLQKLRCPNCEREQDAADTCKFCGLIFSKYKPRGNTPKVAPTNPTIGNLHLYCHLLSSISLVLFIIYSLISFALIMVIVNSVGYISGHNEAYGIEILIAGAITITFSLFASYKVLNAYTKDDTNLEPNTKFITANAVVILSLFPAYISFTPKYQIISTAILLLIVSFKAITLRSTLNQTIFIISLIVIIIATPTGVFVYYQQMSCLTIKENPERRIEVEGDIARGEAPCPILAIKEAKAKFLDKSNNDKEKTLWYEIILEDPRFAKNDSRNAAYHYSIRFRFALLNETGSILAITDVPGADLFAVHGQHIYTNNPSKFALATAEKTKTVYVTCIVSAQRR